MSDWVLPAVPALAPGEATSGLEIRLFGPMAVQIGPCPLPRLRSRKGLWLLALLALRAGRHVERDWLAGTLWPDCSQPDSRRSLRQSLHDLRLALGTEAGRLTGEGPQMLRLDVGGALRAYRQFRALLWREMAAEPSEATTALFRRLREETRARPRPHHPLRGYPPEPPAAALLSSPAPSSQGYLPQPLSAFVGRER